MAESDPDEQVFIDPEAVRLEQGAQQVNFVSATHFSKVASARAGDKDAVRWLLKDFISTIKSNKDANGRWHGKPVANGVQIHPETADFLAEAFEMILHGVQSDRALGLSKGASGADGLSHMEKIQRDFEWCLAIMKERDSGRHDTLDYAKQAVARKCKVSLSAIEKAWKNKNAKISAEISRKLSEGK